jgi:hypothetical protein
MKMNLNQLISNRVYLTSGNGAGTGGSRGKGWPLAVQKME